MPDPFLDALSAVRSREQPSPGTGDAPPDPFLTALREVREPSLSQKVARTGLRVGGAVVGGIGGGLVGGLPGLVIGGGLGAGAGELGAEWLESQPGAGQVRESINPYQVATQTALGAIPIPGAKPGMGFLRAALTQAPKGAVLGGAANVATSIAEGQAPTVGGVAESAALGGLIGGAAGGVFRPRVPQPAAPSPPRGFLRAGPSFVADAQGTVAPLGDVIPMQQAPDGSFVRGVPAEYARREIRGALPPGPSFIANESGGIARLEDAGHAFGAALKAVRAPAAPPAAAGASGGRLIPAAVIDRGVDWPDPLQPGGRRIARLVPTQFSGDPNAVTPERVDLAPDVQHALRWIKEEMESLPYVGRNFNEAGPGQGGKLDVSGGSGGAPIYQAIIGEGRVSTAGRADVLRSINRVMAGDVSSPIDALTLDVARGLAAGDRSIVSRMALPPDAGGDLAGTRWAGPSASTRRGLSEGEEAGIESLDQLQRAMHGEDFVPQGNGAYRPDAAGEGGFEAFAADVDAMATPPRASGREPGEEGFIAPALAARMGGAAAGAVTGAALPGEDATIEDRILGGLAGAGVGYAGGRLLTGPLRGSQSAAPGRGFLRTVLGTPGAGGRVPPAGPIPPDRLKTMPVLTDDVQRAADDLLEQYGGFERRRRGVQSVARTEGLADQIDVDPSQPVKPGTAFNAERLRAYQNATATILAKQKQAAERVKAGTATPAEQLDLERTRTEAAILTGTFRGAAAEAGRALHILRYQARILQTGDTELIREAVQASQRGLKADALAYYYANILSGAATHERNVLGNLSNAVYNLAAHPLAVGADAVRSAATGQPRQVFIGELPERVAGSVAALPRAFSNLFRTLRTGIPGGEVTSFDRPVRAEFRGGGANPFNYPGRLLDAVDDFFATVAGEQTLYAAAFAQAKREGLSGPSLIERVARLKVDPGDEILSEVQSQRTRLLFREDPGQLAKAVLAAKRHVPSLGFVLPFVRVPSNIIRQGFEASPAGFAMKGARQGGRAGADAMGRAALGSLVLAPLAYWTALGKVTGDAPRDPAKRAAFYESGKRPNSIQIGDRWINYQVIQPLNVPLSLVANGFNVWSEAQKDSEATADEIARDAVLRTAGSLLDQSFLSGLSALVDALGDPGRYGPRFVEQLAHGFVPFSAAVRMTAQTLDPTVRAPRGLAESVQSIVPGQSPKLQPRLTRFGEPVQRDSPWNVFKPSREVRDPVADALASADVNIRPAQGPTRVELGRFVQPLPLSGAQRTVVEQASGRAVRGVIERLIASPHFQSAPQPVRQLLLERAIAGARGGVNEQLRREALMRQMQGVVR